MEKKYSHRKCLNLGGKQAGNENSRASLGPVINLLGDPTNSLNYQERGTTFQALITRKEGRSLEDGISQHLPPHFFEKKSIGGGNYELGPSKGFFGFGKPLEDLCFYPLDHVNSIFGPVTNLPKMADSLSWSRNSGRILVMFCQKFEMYFSVVPPKIARDIPTFLKPKSLSERHVWLRANYQEFLQ